MKKQVAYDSITTEKLYFGHIEKDNNTTVIYHSEGQIRKYDSLTVAEYAIKDHLGNVRLLYSDIDQNDSLEILHL